MHMPPQSSSLMCRHFLSPERSCSASLRMSWPLIADARSADRCEIWSPSSRLPIDHCPGALACRRTACVTSSNELQRRFWSVSGSLRSG